MKKLLIVSAIVGLFTLNANQSNAQVNINLNIGPQPTWVPSGYQDVNYYYLPDVQAYYYVPQRQYVYKQRNVWVRSAYLPTRYRNYDLNRGRKVVYRGNTPFGYDRVKPVRYANNRNYQRVEYYDNDRLNHRKAYKVKEIRGSKDKHYRDGRGYKDHKGKRDRH